MNAFKLNLIKDRVPGFRQRRAMFWKMHLYVLLAGGLLVYVSFTATRNVGACQSVMRDSRIIEADFARRYDEERELSDYLHDASSDLTRQIEGMLGIQRTMDKRYLLSPVLAGVAIPLQGEMPLARFELKEGGKFELDISMASERGNRMDSSVLIEVWKSDEKLSSVVKNVNPALMQRQLVETRNLVLLRYEGLLKAGAI